MSQTSVQTVAILDQALAPEPLLRTFRGGLSDVGALVSFTGIVRADGGVRALTLSHYPRYTEKQIAAFIRIARERFDLTAAGVWHRVGTMTPGEPIVLVAVAALHRRAAFEGADYVMDYLKSAAPFWKKEERADGSHWIEPTAQDLADRQRWEIA